MDAQTWFCDDTKTPDMHTPKSGSDRSARLVPSCSALPSSFWCEGTGDWILDDPALVYEIWKRHKADGLKCKWPIER